MRYRNFLSIDLVCLIRKHVGHRCRCKVVYRRVSAIHRVYNFEIRYLDRPPTTTPFGHNVLRRLRRVRFYKTSSQPFNPISDTLFRG